MDLAKLTPHEFQMLCGRLLTAAGFELTMQAGRAQDIAIDFSFVGSAGETWVGEVKHLSRSSAGTAGFRQAAQQLDAAKKYVGASRALLIVSMTLPRRLKEELERRDEITVWDGHAINDLLSTHPSIARDFQMLVDGSAASGRGLLHQPVLEERAKELITALEALPPGRNHWRAFEELCVEILSYALFPHLGIPAVQNRTDDGLDVRDAVYPIAGESVFWDEVKRVCGTRFLVAEFKNHSQPVPNATSSRCSSTYTRRRCACSVFFVAGMSHLTRRILPDVGLG